MGLLLSRRGGGRSRGQRASSLLMPKLPTTCLLRHRHVPRHLSHGRSRYCSVSLFSSVLWLSEWYSSTSQLQEVSSVCCCTKTLNSYAPDKKVMEKKCAC